MTFDHHFSHEFLSLTSSLQSSVISTSQHFSTLICYKIYWESLEARDCDHSLKKLAICRFINNLCTIKKIIKLFCWCKFTEIKTLTKFLPVFCTNKGVSLQNQFFWSYGNTQLHKELLLKLSILARNLSVTMSAVA